MAQGQYLLFGFVRPSRQQQYFKLDPSQDSSVGSISAWYRGGPGFKSQQGQEFLNENIKFEFEWSCIKPSVFLCACITGCKSRQDLLFSWKYKVNSTSYLLIFLTSLGLLDQGKYLSYTIKTNIIHNM